MRVHGPGGFFNFEKTPGKVPGLSSARCWPPSIFYSPCLCFAAASVIMVRLIVGAAL